MLNYQKSFTEYGMLIKNFHDRISEGDGKRILTQWKFIILYLKADGVSSRKYAFSKHFMLYGNIMLFSHQELQKG